MKKSKRGGKRKGAGRKKLSLDEKVLPITLWIKPKDVGINPTRHNDKEITQIKKFLYQQLKKYKI